MLDKPPKSIDTLIVGQGLAGSLLAWRCIQAGQRVALVDTLRAGAASRVAAGLINPITGKRFVKSWKIEHLLPKAEHLYRSLEKALGICCLRALPMLRLFQSASAAKAFQEKSALDDYKAFITTAPSGLDDAARWQFIQPWGCCWVSPTYVLDIPCLLDALAFYFKERKLLLAQAFDYQELQVDPLRWRGHLLKRVVFCEGAHGARNPFFGHLPFQLTKGEILTCRSSAPMFEYVVNKRQWIIPLNEATFRTGATYSWEPCDAAPTLQGLRALEAGLKQLLGFPLSAGVALHQAGIRPGTRDAFPFIGSHPTYKGLFIFNGFGSKGALWIPYCAEVLLNYFSGMALPSALDIERLGLY